MSLRRPSFLLLALVLPLIGCGAEPGLESPIFANTADSATLSALALDARQGMYDELSYVNDQYPSFIGFAPRPRTGAEWIRWARGSAATIAEQDRAPWDHPAPSAAAAALAAVTFTGCEPVITGADSAGPIDTDHDGIPDDWKIDWGTSCVGLDNSGRYRSTLAGSTRVQDTDLGFRSYKVTESHSLNRSEDLVSGFTLEITADGVEEGIFADTGAVRTMHLVRTESQTDSAGTLAHSLDVTKMARFHPDEGEALTPGAPLPAGSFSYDADLKIIDKGLGEPVGGSYHLVFSTPTILHRVPGCGYLFDSGVFRGLLSHASTVGFDYTWNGCAEPVLTIYGDNEVPATIARR